MKTHPLTYFSIVLFYQFGYTMQRIRSPMQNNNRELASKSDTQTRTVYLLELSQYVNENPVRFARSGEKTSGNKSSSSRDIRGVAFPDILPPKENCLGLARMRFWAMSAGAGNSTENFWQTESGRATIRRGRSSRVKSSWENMILSKQVKSKIRGKGSKREQPAVRRFQAKELKTVLKAVADYFGLPEDRLTRRRTGHRNERAIAMELMYRYGGVSQAQIGKVLGNLDYTAVSRERKRLRERMPSDKNVRTALKVIERSLNRR
jgi:hypothetical protein